MKIGVLAAQGAFVEHITMLETLGVAALSIRLPRELEGIDGLIIPGGESTSISRLMDYYNLTGEVIKQIKNGLPVLGTCAGMILLARQLSDSNLEPLGLMDIIVKRNAFGRQVDSFETQLDIPALGKNLFPAVFIRAPIIKQAGHTVDILAKLNSNTIVAVQQDKMIAAAFHPELTDDLRFHKYFLDIVSSNDKSRVIGGYYCKK